MKQSLRTAHMPLLYACACCKDKSSPKKNSQLILLPPIPFLLTALNFMKLKLSTTKINANTSLEHGGGAQNRKKFWHMTWHDINLLHKIKCFDTIRVHQTLADESISFLPCLSPSLSFFKYEFRVFVLYLFPSFCGCDLARFFHPSLSCRSKLSWIVFVSHSKRQMVSRNM